MILSTTPSIDGKKITEYVGIVAGETIVGANVFRDFAASLRDFFGGRSATYEKVFSDARTTALNEMAARAKELKADAIVGIDLDYEVLGKGNGMLMVTASGTAVKFAS
jgi:uncharacterized protein YbjQ (UPF0145 family)